MKLSRIQILIHSSILYGSALLAMIIGFYLGIFLNSLDLLVLSIILAFPIGALGSRLSLAYIQRISERPRISN